MADRGDVAKLLRPTGNAIGLAPSGVRHDGSGAKGKGFFGPLTDSRGNMSTELSIGVDMGGREMEIPSMVPTLGRQEIAQLMSGNISPEIVRKAREFAVQRMATGQSPYAAPNELRATPGMLEY